MGAHEGQFHMGMGVYTTREKVTAAGIDLPVSRNIQLCTNHGDQFPLDIYVGLVMVSGGNNGTVFD